MFFASKLIAQIAIAKMLSSNPNQDISALLRGFLIPTSPYLNYLSNPALAQTLLQQIAVLKFILTLPHPSVERSIREWAFNNLPGRAEGQSYGTGATLFLLGEVVENMKKAVEHGMNILSERRQVDLERLQSPDRAREDAMEVARKILVGLEELKDGLRKRYESASGDLAFRECK